MNNLFELLQDSVGDQLGQQIGSQLGMDQDQTNVALQSAFSAIMSGLSRNVASEQGAQSFLGALDRDHDGSLLDNLKGYLGGGEAAPTNASMLDGAGILSHVLGGNQNGVVSAIAKLAGIDQSKSGQLLVTLAPIVMGLLGKMKNTNNVSNNTILDLIMKGGQAKEVPQAAVPQQAGLMGVFGKLLDQDGDGSFVDDITNMGMKSIMGGLFK